MTDTIDDVAAKAAGQEPVEPALDEQGVAEQLVAQAREKGIELVGPNGLLSQLTKRVLETALEAEMSDHLGYDKHDPVGRNRGNGSFLDVGACGGVHAHAGYHGHVEGAVQPAVAAAVDPVADGVSRGGQDRVQAGETGECGFGPDPSGMGPYGKRDCRGDWSDAGLVKERARGWS
jgi:hypothetical protein